MSFSHPLARGAKVWSARLAGDILRNLLVVVTTLELDGGHKKYNKSKVDELTEAVQEWLSLNSAEADGYVMVNRFKDWHVD